MFCFSRESKQEGSQSSEDRDSGPAGSSVTLRVPILACELQSPQQIVLPGGQGRRTTCLREQVLAGDEIGPKLWSKPASELEPSHLTSLPAVKVTGPAPSS